MGFKLYVGKDLVHETEADYQDVSAVRISTARGEEYVINSDLAHDRVLIEFDIRDSRTSNFLDTEEARMQRARAAEQEAASEEVARRADGVDSSEFELPEGKTLEQVRQEEQQAQAATPMIEKEVQSDVAQDVLAHTPTERSLAEGNAEHPVTSWSAGHSEGTPASEEEKPPPLTVPPQQ